jgi:hypothetical protein
LFVGFIGFAFERNALHSEAEIWEQHYGRAKPAFFLLRFSIRTAAPPRGLTAEHIALTYPKGESARLFNVDLAKARDFVRRINLWSLRVGNGGLDEVRFRGKFFDIRDTDDVHAIPAVGRQVYRLVKRTIGAIRVNELILKGGWSIAHRCFIGMAAGDAVVGRGRLLAGQHAIRRSRRQAALSQISDNQK